MDKDKVLQALNMCEGNDCHCDITHPKCPYLREDDKHANYGFPRCFDEMKKDILAILKEQEAVTIKKTKEHGFGVYGGICPKCRNWIQSPHSFCGFCGQEVKWE